MATFPQMNIKAVLKTLVLAPSAATLSYVITDILYSIAVNSGALSASTSGTYPLAVGAVVFALVVVMGLDDIFA